MRARIDRIAADAALFSIIRCKAPVDTAIHMLGQMSFVMREGLGPRKTAEMLREMATLMDRQQQ